MLKTVSFFLGKIWNVIVDLNFTTKFRIFNYNNIHDSCKIFYNGNVWNRSWPKKLEILLKILLKFVAKTRTTIVSVSKSDQPKRFWHKNYKLDIISAKLSWDSTCYECCAENHFHITEMCDCTALSAEKRKMAQKKN